MRSVLVFPLAGEFAAWLSLFGEGAGAFTEESLKVANAFAAHASTLVALYEAQSKADNLETALLHSRQIGAAIGILMGHHKITEEDAFALLRLASQRLHRKLREVAAEVLDTGVLPDLPKLRSRPVGSVRKGLPSLNRQRLRQ